MIIPTYEQLQRFYAENINTIAQQSEQLYVSNEALKVLEREIGIKWSKKVKVLEREIVNQKKWYKTLSEKNEELEDRNQNQEDLIVKRIEKDISRRYKESISILNNLSSNQIRKIEELESSLEHSPKAVDIKKLILKLDSSEKRCNMANSDKMHAIDAYKALLKEVAEKEKQHRQDQLMISSKGEKILELEDNNTNQQELIKELREESSSARAGVGLL